MRFPVFQANDKVTFLAGFNTEACCHVPRLRPGRVYCVERIHIIGGLGWVHLTGVRANRRCCEAGRGVSPDTLRLVSRDRKEAA